MTFSTKLGGIGDAFADRNFRIYSVASIASWTGFFVQLVAVSWLAWELTGSTAWLAAVGLMDILPNIALLPIAGVIADRVDRYRMLAILYVLTFLQAAVLAGLAFAGLLTIWPLAILTLIHGILISFVVPAMHAMLPRFIARARLASAIAVNSAYTQLALFVGPALAGWIIVQYGVGAAFAVNAFAYVVYLVAMAFLKTPADYTKPAPSTGSYTADIVDGIRYIAGNPGLAMLVVLIFATDAAVSGFFHMLPAYSDEHLGMGVVGLSAIRAMEGAGAAVAALLLAYGGVKALSTNRLLWSMIASVLCVGLFVVVDDFAIVIGIAIVMGVCWQLAETAGLSLIQLTIDDEQRGRVMGNLFLVSQIGNAIGTFFIGTLAVTYGLTGPILIAVGLCTLVWFFVWLRRKAFAEAFDGFGGDAPT